MAVREGKTKYKKSKSRFLPLLFILLLILAVAIWGIISLFTQDQEETRYAFFNEGSIYESYESDFLLLRQERNIKAKTDGLLLPLVAEGEKVGTGENYALIVPYTAENLYNSYLETQEAIYERALSLCKEKNIKHSREELGDDLIKNAVFQVQQALFAEDLDQLSLAHENLQTVWLKRLSLLRPEAEEDVTLKELINESETILDQIRLKTPAESVLRSIEPCWISFCSFDKPLNLPQEASFNQLNSLWSNLSIYNSTAMENKRVAKGDNVARTISTKEQLFFAKLPNLYLDDDLEHEFQILTAKNTLIDDLEIRRISDGDDKYLLLESQSKFSDLLNEQVLPSAQLLSKKINGIKVPRYSLFDYSAEDNIAKIFKMHEGTVTEVIVFVRALNDNYAIIEGREGDELAPEVNELYVLNPWTSEEGDLLD